MCAHTVYICATPCRQQQTGTDPATPEEAVLRGHRDVRHVTSSTGTDTTHRPPGGHAASRPAAHAEECPPYPLAQPPLDNHLTLISAQLTGEKWYCVPVFCYVSRSLGELDLNYRDCH